MANAEFQPPLLVDRFWPTEGEVDAPVLVRTREQWDGWRGEDELPAWRIDRLIEIDATLIPYSAVAVPSGDTYRYIYWGSGLTYIHGEDFTGKVTEPIKHFVNRQQNKTTYGQVFKSKKPTYMLLRFTCMGVIEGEQVCVRLPFGANGTATHVLTVTLFRGSDPEKPWTPHHLIKLWPRRLEVS